MRAPMRAPLLRLCIAALALAAASAACFDWDGYLARCRDAGNCGAEDASIHDGGDGGGNGGDGGDGGGLDGSTNPRDDGGASGRDSGFGQVGDVCADPADCGSNTCAANRCVCLFGGTCITSVDCCLGEVCMG